MQKLTLSHEISVEHLVDTIINTMIIVFDKRILSIYLSGSLSRHQMTPNSDIDMMVIFRDMISAEEEHRFMEVRKVLQTLSPVRLDLWPESEQKLKVRPASSTMRSSPCLYGEPFLEHVPAQTIEAYAMRSIHKAIHYMTVLRGRPKINRTPLHYPDQSDHYFGYTKQGGFDGAGSFTDGTRIIVDMMTRCTTARIAIELGIESDTKQTSIDIFSSRIGGRWSPFVNDSYQFIKTDLAYNLPDHPDAQQKLRTLCHQLLDFENDAHTKFIPHIMNSLQSDDRRQRKLALVAIKNIQFEHDAMSDILSTIHIDDTELLATVRTLYHCD